MSTQNIKTGTERTLEYIVGIDVDGKGGIQRVDDLLSSLVLEPGPRGSDGTNGTNGIAGTDGAAGLSAYQVAVAQGFVGNKDAWLLSLKGDQGVQGIQGIQGEAGLNGINGNNGLNGEDGADGTNGTDGEDGVSIVDADVDGSGDLILTLSTADTINAGHVVGATGATGATGAKGDTGATGAAGAAGTNGTNGTNGVDGVDGVDGTDGAAATIALGTITTLAAGEDATFVNVGTSSAAVFDIGIPRGNPGTGGAGSWAQVGSTIDGTGENEIIFSSLSGYDEFNIQFTDAVVDVLTDGIALAGFEWSTDGGTTYIGLTADPATTTNNIRIKFIDGTDSDSVELLVDQQCAIHRISQTTSLHYIMPLLSATTTGAAVGVTRPIFAPVTNVRIRIYSWDGNTDDVTAANLLSGNFKLFAKS